MIIYCKVAKQLTDPIYKLQEAIETSNTKDESVFKYEYDDMINELFITCKELLTCQIDTSSNNKYSGQFNILSIPKDKDKVIDKSKYEKNLIINNDIMNQLIKEQQNMMDFNEDIGTNEDPDSINNNNLNDINNNIINDEEKKEKEKKEENEENKENKEKNDNNDNNNNNDINNNNSNNINDDNLNKNKIKDEVEKDKTAYKNLFRLAEYLYYYRCKEEGNNIAININSLNEDKKSVVSRVNNNNSTYNNTNNKKLKKSGTRSGINADKNDDNNTINILRGKDLTYLWYMEMKKKNNRSFTYQLSEDYEELFMDYYSSKNQ